MTAPEQENQQRRQIEEANRVAMARTEYYGGRFAILISFVALVFSGISVYETILKRAEPAVHIGGVIHYAHDVLQPYDVFIVPVTITNSGARDAIIVELKLDVEAENTTGDQAITLLSRYAGTNPRSDRQPFAPLSVPGGGAFSGAVLFYRDRIPGTFADPVIGGNQSLRFCLTARAAPSGVSFLDWDNDITDPSIAFDGRVIAYSREDLSAGRTIPLRISGTEANGADEQAGC